MKQIWTARVAEIAGKYGENAPTAAVCCNACRTCVTTNLIGLAGAGTTAAALWLARPVRRLLARAS
jgi:hypothetical protein